MRRGGVAATDIGSTKICTLVGGFDDQGRLRITGRGITTARGMSKGKVDDVGKLTEAVAHSLRLAERNSNSRIAATTIGITGSHIACLNSRGTVALANRDKPIAEEDVKRALEGARTVAIPNNREILHAVPRFYILDGEESYGDPIGKFGHRLDVEAHIITGAVTAVQNLTKCVEAAGVQVEGLVLQQLAAADAVLDEEERTHGVVVADIGGGSTDVAVFVEGAIVHSAVLPIGGNSITNDIVYGLRIPFSAADAAKEIYGSALPELVDAEETIEVDAFGMDRQRLISRRRMCEIIQARVEEIVERIGDEVRRATSEEMISAGLVLTGGSANLAGIADLGARVLAMPARIGGPSGIPNLGETLENPAFSTSIGLLGWAVREHDAVLRPARSTAERPARSGNALWRRVSGLARIMLPE